MLPRFIKDMCMWYDVEVQYGISNWLIMFISYILELIFFIWGCVEYWNVPCIVELHGTLLYETFFVNFLIFFAVIVVDAVKICCDGLLKLF